MSNLTLAHKCIDWENGDMSESEAIDFFQHLVNVGLAWQLQGMYGRQANTYLQQGRIHLPESQRL